MASTLYFCKATFASWLKRLFFCPGKYIGPVHFCLAGFFGNVFGLVFGFVLSNRG